VGPSRRMRTGTGESPECDSKQATPRIGRLERPWPYWTRSTLPILGRSRKKREKSPRDGAERMGGVRSGTCSTSQGGEGTKGGIPVLKTSGGVTWTYRREVDDRPGSGSSPLRPELSKKGSGKANSVPREVISLRKGQKRCNKRTRKTSSQTR